MRKILCIIGLLLSCCLSVKADEILTATLQHKGQMTPFFGDSAFYYANRSAQDGDTITLSPGYTFVSDSIRKSICVIGCNGVKSSWSSGGEPYFFYINPTHFRTNSRLYVCADNVYIEGLNTSYLYLGNISNCTIKRCGGYIYASSSTIAHTNTLVEQCYFYLDNAIQKGINYVIRNSHIVEFNSMNTPTNMATITNCYIRDFYVQNRSNKQPYAIYTNCILGLDANAKDSPERPFEPLPPYQFKAPSEFRYNYLYRWNNKNVAEYFVPFVFAAGCVNENNVVSSESYSAVRCYTSSYDTPECYTYDSPNYWGPITGSDGKQIGLRGGEIGFVERSGIPHGWPPTCDEITDINGQWKIQFSYGVIKAHPEDTPSLELIEYWVDDPYGEKQIIPKSSSMSRQTFDFSALKAGKHTFYYRYKDNYGAYSPLYVQSFERRNPYDEVLLLPYNATSLDEEQQTANPTYMAYPTEIESQMPTIQCDDSN